jgi:nitroimidazol reductase NimA-like FMN-containing flavoprotein (pyridoxamine 5'-phosphate oxidase superfamily)
MGNLDREFVDRLLSDEPMCRFATINPRGPHVTPVGFLWDGSCVWIASQIHAQRFVDLQRDPRVALVVESQVLDEGYVEVIGDAAVVGEVPCVGATTTELEAVERLWTEKLGYPLDLVYDREHAWVRVTPRKVVRAFAHEDDDRVREASQMAIDHIAARRET